MPKKRRAGGKRAAAALAEPEPEPEPEPAWVCAECAQENEGADAACVACEEPRPARPGGGGVTAARQIDGEAFLYERVLPPQVCSLLIGMSHTRAFSLDPENVDDRPVYQIDLVQNGWVCDGGIWSVIGPLFDAKLQPLLAELPWLKGKAFTLDFAFLKRYRPEERTHLGIHLDSSFFTFNVLLSQPKAFEGGGIYIFDPQQTQKHFARHEAMTTEQKQAWVLAQERLPIVEGYGCGDVLAFTGDRHLHGT